MKKIALFLSITFLLCNCVSKKIINNAPHSYSFTSDKSFDEVWSNVIDFISLKGVSIKNIDKESGLIVTDEYSLTGSYTYEDKNGSLKNPNAYVVLQKRKGGFGNTIKPDFIHGNYNIRVKPEKNGTSITINLVNLIAGVTVNKNIYGGGGNMVYYVVKSTNVFEKELAQKLNQ